MTSKMGKGSRGGQPTFLLDRRRMLRRMLLCAAALVLIAPSGDVLMAEEGATQSAGLSLVMIEEQGCGFCMRWHREVGPGYAKSEEGRTAPLVLVDRESKEASHFQRIVFTPTFILMRNGAEVGRITGFPGADLFWWQLGDLIRKHGGGTAVGRSG